MTRDTFIDGESSGIVPLDEFGRQMGLPPNSAANASFLQQLRYMLVQDYDSDDDGRADTLRLCFATPRRWLEDGKQIVVERAPTQFGDVSFRIKSDLKHNRVTAEIDLPPRAPKRTLLRLRLPSGMKIASANMPTAGPETLDLTDRTRPLPRGREDKMTVLTASGNNRVRFDFDERVAVDQPGDFDDRRGRADFAEHAAVDAGDFFPLG